MLYDICVIHQIHIFVFTECKDGDVSFHEDNPLVFWKGEFLRICGDGFWDNSHGAELFCKKLGYESGRIQTVSGASTSTLQALQVGSCSSTDTSLSDCHGAANHYSRHQFKDCSAHHTYKITCSGGVEILRASCIPG